MYGDAPTQTAGMGMGALFGPGRKCKDDIGKMGDDCLNINIVSPDPAGTAPVMVFVHGGANKMGSNKGSNKSNKGGTCTYHRHFRLCWSGSVCYLIQDPNAWLPAPSRRGRDQPRPA